MEIDKSEGSYAVKGGKTILGKIFQYQEKTGMPVKDIMKLPYIFFVIGMLDAPAIDYDKKKQKTYTPETGKDEINAFMGFLG